MLWILFLTPIISALIGWGTNVIAIKMLFRPRKPVRIPIIGFELIGVLPKRQADIAHSIGDVVNNDLLPIQDIVDAVNTKEMRHRVTHLIFANLQNKLQRYLPRFVPSGAKEMLGNYLLEVISKEIDDLFGNLGKTIGAELHNNDLLGQLVEEKIRSFELQQLEDLIFRIARTELRYIELFGAVVGFIIGIFQSLVLFAIQ